MTVLEDAYQKALDNKKKNDYSNYIWKGEKTKEGDKYVQDSKRMIDMTAEELQDCFNRCNIMLYNNNPKNLGRYNILDEIEDQINKCNVELFLRYCENTYKPNERKATSRTRLRLSLRKFIDNSNLTLKENGRDELNMEEWANVPISAATSQLPEEFENISIYDVMEGCIGCLGAFNKKHLTMTFITKMGIWFTKAEENEFKGSNCSNIEKLKIVKEKLRLPSKLILRFSEKGISYHEMKAILNLPKKQRYSDMTTEQLLTLRDKILMRLAKKVESHIYSWNNLKKQLITVAKSKNIELINNL